MKNPHHNFCRVEVIMTFFCFTNCQKYQNIKLTILTRKSSKFLNETIKNRGSSAYHRKLHHRHFLNCSDTGLLKIVQTCHRCSMCWGYVYSWLQWLILNEPVVRVAVVMAQRCGHKLREEAADWWLFAYSDIYGPDYVVTLWLVFSTNGY